MCRCCCLHCCFCSATIDPNYVKNEKGDIEIQIVCTGKDSKGERPCQLLRHRGSGHRCTYMPAAYPIGLQCMTCSRQLRTMPLPHLEAGRSGMYPHCKEADTATSARQITCNQGLALCGAWVAGRCFWCSCLTGSGQWNGESCNCLDAVYKCRSEG